MQTLHPGRVHPLLSLFSPAGSAHQGSDLLTTLCHWADLCLFRVPSLSPSPPHTPSEQWPGRPAQGLGKCLGRHAAVARLQQQRSDTSASLARRLHCPAFTAAVIQPAAGGRESGREAGRLRREAGRGVKRAGEGSACPRSGTQNLIHTLLPPCAPTLPRYIGVAPRPAGSAAQPAPARGQLRRASSSAGAAGAQ